jgi:hypothetical protein
MHNGIARFKISEDSISDNSVTDSYKIIKKYGNYNLLQSSECKFVHRLSVNFDSSKVTGDAKAEIVNYNPEEMLSDQEIIRMYINDDDTLLSILDGYNENSHLKSGE